MSAQVWQLQLGRGVVHTAAVILWFYAMARLPVAEVTAINFLNPVLVSLGAVALFGERLTVARIVLTGVAFCGVLIVLRPGLRAVEAGHLAQLIAAFGFAASYLFAKRLSGLIDATAVVAGLSGLVTLGLLPFAIMVWQPVSVMQLALLALVAGFATAGHYAMTRAFAVAPMAVTQPVVFLQLVWASALGMLVFDEALDRFVLIGGAVIIGAISLQAALEHRREKRR